MIVRPLLHYAEEPAAHHSVVCNLQSWITGMRLRQMCIAACRYCTSFVRTCYTTQTMLHSDWWLCLCHHAALNMLQCLASSSIL